MQSYIKKSTLIRDFRMQVSGKKMVEINNLDKPFFEIVNRVFKNKPHDINFHITKQNSLVLNIQFGFNVEVYIENFRKGLPDTLISISYGESNIDDPITMHSANLNECLDIIDESITKNLS